MLKNDGVKGQGLVWGQGSGVRLLACPHQQLQVLVDPLSSAAKQTHDLEGGKELLLRQGPARPEASTVTFDPRAQQHQQAEWLQRLLLLLAEHSWSHWFR